jgi:hypothetical protein
MDGPCAKVNLDYFFARIDNDQYGVSPRYATESGDLKDPYGDLGAGLPWAAVEGHQPFRLFVMINASADVAHRSLLASPQTLALVRRNWVRLVCSRHEKV